MAIPVNSKQYHSIGTQIETVKATIDVENMAHIMNHLSTPYNDPILAVIREYSTNAWDSHVEAGVEAPIEVTLPTSGNPKFVVQDRGLGLDYQALHDTYLSYGNSDKRTSNLVTGMLGFGSKSGTAYAPLGWQVEGVKNGEKTIATVARDAEGVPEMAILFRGPTDEPNGVKITIPVQDSDRHLFHERAQHLYRFWVPGTVLVDGEEPVSVFDDDDITWIEAETVGVTTTGYHSYVVMGNVPYAFDGKVWGHHVIAFVEMGAVEFPLSRESLKLTDHTKDTLDSLIEFANDRVLAGLRERIAEQATSWGQVSEYQRIHRSLPDSLARIFAKEVIDLLPKRHVATVAYAFAPFAYRNKITRLNALTPSSFQGHQNTGVVTDYISTATISPKRRYHLSKFASEHGLQRVIVLTGGVDEIDFLPGFVPEAQATWAELEEAYPHPKRESRGRAKTLYELVQAGVDNGSLAEDEWDPANGPITYVDYGNRWNRAGEIARQESRRVPEAQVAVLNANQTAKFVRLNPTAKPLSEYISEQVAKARKIAEQSKIRIAAHADAFAHLRDNRIQDPLVRQVAEAPKSRLKDRIAFVNRLGVTIDRPTEHDVVRERYPLLDRVRFTARQDEVDDLVLYLNAKYVEVQVAEAMVELDNDLNDCNDVADVDAR